MRLSFKKGKKASRLARIGDPYPQTEILGDSKSVGWMKYSNNTSYHQGDNKWSISLHIKEGTSFKNVKLKARFDTEPEARAFVTKNWDLILQKFQLHQIE
jgi:hypothetical protein